jgi:hypothetical protein
MTSINYGKLGVVSKKKGRKSRHFLDLTKVTDNIDYDYNGPPEPEPSIEYDYVTQIRPDEHDEPDEPEPEPYYENQPNPGNQILPSELFGEELEDNDLEEGEIKEDLEQEKEKESIKKIKQQKLDDLIRLYYKSEGYLSTPPKNHELEVRFGTKGKKPLNKNDYENVIKKIKSFGFTSQNENGIYSLRITNDFLSKRGTYQQSQVRTQVDSLDAIQKYCKTNEIAELANNRGTSIHFVKKQSIIVDNNKVLPVDFDDFNFRISYQIEEDVNKGIKGFIIKSWKECKKTFRYMNRVTFSHPDYPVNVDISIVKSSNFVNKFQYVKTYNIQDSNVFNNKEKIEIELELINEQIGPKTKFNSPDKLAAALRKVIKMVLCGLQGTNFPVSYPEQRNVMNEYMLMLYNKEIFRPEPRNFIGPSSLPIQIENVCEIDENLNAPNIRKNFVVTEKADGERHLLYVSSEGKIYLINNNMNVIFTGALTLNKNKFNTLLDGELISTNKQGKFINLFAIFDMYYDNKEDIRKMPFMLKPDETDVYRARYMRMNKFLNDLKPFSILEPESLKKQKTDLQSYLNKYENKYVCPIRIITKKFEPEHFVGENDIFHACNRFLTKIEDNRYEYFTDGLIFTPAYLGAGANKENEAGPLVKITWSHSFKWKPLKENTIDFFVVTIKNTNNEDTIKNIYEDGIKADAVTQLSEYKSIQLCCTYSEKKHGSIYLNPCQDILEGKIPSATENISEEKEYVDDRKAMQFYPTDPFDPEAGIANIMLKSDNNGTKQMYTEENEIFGDNTIVEFSYEIEREKGWRWIPKRVRYDKTSEYLQGIKNFGNAYHVANSNWKLINNPITEEMMRTGKDIPPLTVAEDVYYNKQPGKSETEAMKNFHNLYVKKMLIKTVSRPDDTLIDYACGKAGDLPKWISARLSFVFGIDISSDNIDNRVDGACVRYLNIAKTNKHVPDVLFVNGNSMYNIKNGEAMLNEKAVHITKSIFGNTTKEKAFQLGQGVAKQYKVAESGFKISSCQFAVHYFFESPESLKGFLTNVSECTALNGYFIGTCYNGREIFDLLKKKQEGESFQIHRNGKKIWEIIKGYSIDSFDDDESSLGLKIEVYQESINQTITEYLVNFDYFNRILVNYGFKLIDKAEANKLGLPNGVGSFDTLYKNMMYEIKRDSQKIKDYGDAMNMNEYEKKISFLNNYFVYKKILNVNTKQVEIESENFHKSDDDKTQPQVKDFASQMKIRNVKKQIVLVPATEALESENSEVENEEKIQDIVVPTIPPKLDVIDEDKELEIIPNNPKKNKTKKNRPSVKMTNFSIDENAEPEIVPNNPKKNKTKKNRPSVEMTNFSIDENAEPEIVPNNPKTTKKDKNKTKI